LKVSLSTVHKIHVDAAFTVAALGALYNKASSPKESPVPYVLTCFSSPPLIYYLKKDI